MGKLTTHILDTANGRPGDGIAIELYCVSQGSRQLLGRHVSNADGRVDAPLLEGDALVAGVYELDFGIGEYFSMRGTALPEPRFLDVVTLRFGISDASAHYHVPLLASPWSYSTYRGS